MSRNYLTALLLLCLLSIPAHAASCDEELKKITDALETADLSDDQRAQVIDLKEQAEELCKSGNPDDAQEVLKEAKDMLSIQ